MTEIRPGIIQYASFPAALQDRQVFWHGLDAILADPYYAVVELSTLMAAADVPEVRRRLQAAGRLSYLSAGPQLLKVDPGLCGLDRAGRAEAVDLVRRLVDMAYELGALGLMLISGHDPGPAQRPAALQALAESLHTVAAYAREQQPQAPLTISLETFDQTTWHRQALGPTSEALRLLTVVGAEQPNFAMTIDISHLAQLGEDPVASVASLGARAGHLHMATCVVTPGHPLFGDQHPPFDAPGVAVDVATAGRAIGAALAARRAAGVAAPLTVSIEIKPLAGTDPDVVLRQTRRDLERAIDLASAQ